MRLEKLSLIGTALVLSTLASVASAQDVPELENGEVLRGNAHSYDEAAETVQFTLNDGTERTLKTEELERMSAYKIAKSRAEKGNPDDEFRLGNFARTIELYAHAARHYDAAEKADPGRVEAAPARQPQERRAADGARSAQPSRPLVD